MPSPRAIIKPELLVWAREEAGLSLDEAAKKVAVKPDRLLACEEGTSQLTVNQLRTLSKAYKRPLAFFFLPQPPPRAIGLRDFRRLPGEPAKSESPSLRYELRRARYRRQVALALYEELGEVPPAFEPITGIAANPETVATQIREFLGITREEQYAFRGEYDALNRWRAAIEDSGVMVFQAGRIDRREMRGFSISENILPVIVSNVKDAPLARVFTMIHELAHLMLRAGGLCNLEEAQAIEVFCNQVAGATLVPRDWLLNENNIRNRGPQEEWNENIIRLIANRYRVSKEVIVRRLLTTGYATQAFYQQKREEYQRQFEAREEGGFTTPDVKAVSQAGRRFVQLVLDSYHQDKINTSDVSEYLEVRIKHLDKIEQAVRNPTLEIGAA
jgi:Zn-dependent peptidase ImmA (M78 family)